MKEPRQRTGGSAQNGAERHVLSLGAYLACAFAGLSILVTMVTLVVIERTSSRQMADEIGEGLAGLAHQTARRLDRSLWERHRELRIISRRLAQAPGRAAMQREVEVLQASYPFYTWVGVADVNGIVQAGSEQLLLGASVAQRPWFQGALRGHEVFEVHDAVLLQQLVAQRTREPLRLLDLAFLVPQPGESPWVLGAHLDWTWARYVTETIFPSEATGAPELLIVSREGTVLLGPPQWQGRTLDLPSLQAASRSIRGWNTETWDGIEYVVGYSHSQPYRGSSGLGWRVLVRQELGAAYSPVRALQLRVLTFGLLIAAAFSLLGWMVASRITRPWSQLVDTAVHGGHAAGRGEVAGLKTFQEVELLRNAIEASHSQLQESASALERRERELQGILKTAMDAVITIDEQQNIILFNDAAEQMFGLSRETALGTNIRVLLPEASRQAHSDHIRNFGESGGVTRAMRSGRVVHGRRWNGEEFPIEASISASYSAGSARVFTVIMRDITERLKEREQLIVANEELRAFAERFDRSVLAQLDVQQAAIARELHDSLGSTLAGITMLLAGARGQSPSGNATTLLDRALVQVEHAAQMTRAMSHGLMPLGPDAGALVQVLEQFAQTIAASGDIDCRVGAEGHFELLQPEAANHVFRIVQEAVTNSIRHGQATAVEIQLTQGAARNELVISDNGHGFDPAGVSQSHPGIGLKSIRARAGAIGGEVFWERTPFGLELHVSWPHQ